MYNPYEPHYNEGPSIWKIVVSILLIYTVMVILLVIKHETKKDEHCDKPIINYFYKTGEIVTHIASNEPVRILGSYGMIGGSECRRRSYRLYSVRFTDGAEIDAEWSDLSIIEPLKPKKD